MIATDEKQLDAAEVPPLRVFRGEEENQSEGHRPSEPTGHSQRQWLEREIFWAGRNRARRLSARLVA
jgi:hypothetical protein